MASEKLHKIVSRTHNKKKSARKRYLTNCPAGDSCAKTSTQIKETGRPIFVCAYLIDQFNRSESFLRIGKEPPLGCVCVSLEM